MCVVLGLFLGRGNLTTAKATGIDLKSAKALENAAEAAARPQTSIVGVRPGEAPAMLAPLIVLYDQNSLINLNATSQNFETANDAFDNQAADDFVVTAGGGWNVTSVFAPGVYAAAGFTPTSMRVAFYADAGGVPGAILCDFPTAAFVQAPAGSFTIPLPGGCLLSPGTKWVSVVANLPFTGGTQWFWSTRTLLTGNPSKWQNPGGGFAVGCLTWATRTTCLTQTDPDMAFRLEGDIASCQNNGDCADGNLCNGVETCNAGTCQPGTPVVCNDGLFCTTDTCTPATGACVFSPNLCNDGDSCTLDSCSEGSGCTNFAPPPIQFCNTGSITIPSSGAGTPYPSSISVSGLSTSASLCSVELRGMNHTWAGDIDILLVGPTGGAANRTIMSDVGGSGDLINTTLTLKDAAATALPTTATNIATGTYRPTNNGAVDTFAAPAPAPTGLSNLSLFNGTNPNGNWSLFVVDDATGDLGNISGGWCVNLVVAGCANDGQCSDGNLCNGVESCIGGSCQPGTPVNCNDGLFCTIDSCIPATGQCSYAPNPCNDGNGCTADSCVEGTGCVNTAACVTFCNTNLVTINDSTTPPTTATPYPSTITVAGMSVPASVAQVRLLNLSHTFPDDIDMLLVSSYSPAVNATIMSDVGGSADLVGINLTLTDAATASMSDAGPLVGGTYKPTNIDTTTDAFPAPAPAATGLSPLSTFGTTDLNGTWSLFVIDDLGTDSGTMAGGWCLDLLPFACTQNGDCDDQSVCTADTCVNGACQNVPDPSVCDDFNPCTTDSCTAENGCGYVPTVCDDGDPCTVDSCVTPIGCVFTASDPAGEVSGVQYGADKETVGWNSQAGSVVYDVVRGALNAFPVGPDGGDEVCFGDLVTTSLVDPTVPSLGQGFWYLVRGENGCGVGQYGDMLLGGVPAARATLTCTSEKKCRYKVTHRDTVGTGADLPAAWNCGSKCKVTTCTTVADCDNTRYSKKDTVNGGRVIWTVEDCVKTEVRGCPATVNQFAATACP